jgi:hypothetical protein
VHHLGRKGRKGGQGAEEAGDEEQLELGRHFGIDVEHGDRDADQIAADQVGASVPIGTVANTGLSQSPRP